MCKMTLVNHTISRYSEFQFSSVTVVSYSLWRQASLTITNSSSSCPLSWWCHPNISSSIAPLFLLPSIFPSIRVFSNELALHIRWPKHWSVSISPSNECSELICFRMDWFDLLAVQGTLKIEPQFKSTSSSVLSFLYSPTQKSYEQPRHILKSEDITLPAKVHLVKAMVFPVVMYACESWTINSFQSCPTLYNPMD